MLKALLLASTVVLTAQEAVPAAPQAPAAAQTPALVQAPAPPKSAVTKVGDDGLLEYAYFGAELDLAKAHEADFFWMKPGLNLKGRTIAGRPWEAKVLKTDRQEKDVARAKGLSLLLQDSLMSGFQAAFKDHATWQVGGEADYRFEGRVVDANVPNTASKLMFGWIGGKNNLENATYDLKLVDAKTGETVLAAHHRMVKVNTLGSLDSSLRSWSEDFAKEVRGLMP